MLVVSRTGLAEVQQIQAVNNEKKAQLKSAKDALDALTEIIQKKGKSSLDDWQEALDDFTEKDITPEARAEIQKRITESKAKLQSVNSLLTPEEQARINIMRVDVDLSATTETEKYAGIFEVISAGVQDEDRKRELNDKIAKILKTDNPNIKVGSDVKKEIDLGYGVDENGEKIPYTKEHPLQIREGITGYPVGTEENRELIMEAELFGGRKLKFKANLSDSDMTEKINIIIVMSLAETKGLTGITHNQGTIGTQGGDVIDLDNTGIINGKSSQFAKSVVRNYIGGITNDVDVKLITAEQMKEIDWAFQWFGKNQGDISGGSDGSAEKNDEQSAKTAMRELGIFDKNGNLQQNVLKKALLFLQEQKYGGAPNFQSLKKHLQGEKKEK